jgi:hypothetical protein
LRTGLTRRRDAARLRKATRRAVGLVLQRTGSWTDEAAKVRSRTGRTFRLGAEVWWSLRVKRGCLRPGLRDRSRDRQ